MLEIIKVLMSFGMDFEYENHGSNGEKIISFECGLEISNHYGKIYFQLSAPTETFEESDSTYNHLAEKVKKECIDQTASF